MTSPFIPCPFTYGDAPQGGSVMPMIIANRDPSNTQDVNYAAGYLWLSDLSQGGTGNLFIQEGFVAGLPNWVALSAGAAGGVNTISGVSPTGGDIDMSSTPNQVIATPSLASHEVIFSLSPVLITPGSIETPSTLEVGTDLTVHGDATFDQNVDVTGDVQVDGNLNVDGTITFDGLTVAGTVNLNVTGNAATNIGNAGGSGLILIDVPSGDLTINGNANDILIGQDAAANHIVIGSTTGAAGTIIKAGTDDLLLTGAVTSEIMVGDVAQTGTITLGLSTAGQNVNIASAINTQPQTIAIGNGASNGNSTVNILSGIGTSGVGVLALGNNTRVTTIGLGNIAPAAARTIAIAGGNSAQNDTVTVFGGAPSANAQVFNLFSGNASGGTQTVNVGTGTNAMALNLGTGATGAKTIAIGGTAANVITIANTQTAGSFAVGNAMTTGTIAIGGTAQTGTMTLGSSSGTNIVNIAAGAGASTVNIANAQVAGAVNIGAGMTTGTITVGGTGLQTGTVSIAPGTGAQTVNIGTGATGVKTINIGTGAVADLITVGNSTAGNITTLASSITALPGPVYVYTGAGAPSNALALHVGDLYINTTAASAVTRMYIATAASTWTNFTCAA